MDIAAASTLNFCHSMRPKQPSHQSPANDSFHLSHGPCVGAINVARAAQSVRQPQLASNTADLNITCHTITIDRSQAPLIRSREVHCLFPQPSN